MTRRWRRLLTGRCTAWQSSPLNATSRLFTRSHIETATVAGWLTWVSLHHGWSACSHQLCRILPRPVSSTVLAEQRCAVQRLLFLLVYKIQWINEYRNINLHAWPQDARKSLMFCRYSLIFTGPLILQLTESSTTRISDVDAYIQVEDTVLVRFAHPSPKFQGCKIFRSGLSSESASGSSQNRIDCSLPQVPLPKCCENTSILLEWCC